MTIKYSFTTVSSFHHSGDTVYNLSTGHRFRTHHNHPVAWRLRWSPPRWQKACLENQAEARTVKSRRVTDGTRDNVKNTLHSTLNGHGTLRRTPAHRTSCRHYFCTFHPHSTIHRLDAHDTSSPPVPSLNWRLIQLRDVLRPDPGREAGVLECPGRWSRVAAGLSGASSVPAGPRWCPAGLSSTCNTQVDKFLTFFCCFSHAGSRSPSRSHSSSGSMYPSL